MAYDAAAAHEYYMKYRKKGLKKGRRRRAAKSSSSKSKKKNTLLNVSTSGLNDAGKIEASLIKERISTELSAALSKASDAERDNLRREYSKKAQQEIAALKSKKEFAAPKKAKKKVSKAKKQSLKNSINTIKQVLPTATDEQKKQLSELITSLLNSLG